MARINARAAKDERVLVTTLTKKMAEDLTEYFKNAGIKVRYMHSDVETIERMEIIRDLRLGKFDVLVGINLLREGLDLPEVSLVTVLDADKEGFLRACLDRSLEALDQTLAEVTAEPAGFKEYAGRIIRALLRFSRDHAGYVRLYCALAASGGEEAAGLAGEIEGVTARLYARTIAAGQAAGDLRY